MFEHLKGYKHILVSGCQRSGTNLCTRIIQYDLDIPKYIALGNGIKTLEKYLNGHETQKVYHAPGASRWLEEYGDRDDVAVIWMRRDFEDVLESAKKIDWGCSPEMEAYGLNPPRESREDKLKREKEKKEWRKKQEEARIKEGVDGKELRRRKKEARMKKEAARKKKEEEKKELIATKFPKDVKLVYDAKYEYWEEVQKPRIKHWFEVEYESLKDHVMWIDPKNRKFPHTEATANGRRLDRSLDALLRRFPKK